ncbi:MAG: hypothetical protein KAU21_07655, partial [Gammaproteobacteria bacterium]|nr:hypothetical protein [Gammaproteobacteria bacterium]
ELTGEVKNCTGVVEILVQGDLPDIEAFQSQLITKAPPLAEPEILQSNDIQHKPFNDFKILISFPRSRVGTHTS